jgi:hypothetical protein
MNDATNCPCGRLGRIFMRGTNYCGDCLPKEKKDTAVSEEDARMLKAYKYFYYWRRLGRVGLGQHWLIASV